MSNFARSQPGLDCRLLSLCLLLFQPCSVNAATSSERQPAKPITEFRQRFFFEDTPPTEKTEVRILYSRHAVYFGIHCYDSEPSRIIATELRRDAVQALDDHFEILIDSNHDRRGAYVFEVNPLGTQSDGLIV